MDNPFADIQTEREQREQRKEQARQEGQRKLEAERIAAEQRKVISLEFDQMVRPVLEQLRDAAYPQYQVVGCYAEVPRNLMKLEGSWSIGKKEAVHRALGGEDWDEDYWSEKVRIDLEFDAHNQPLQFKCTRFGKYKRQKPAQPLPPPNKSLWGRSGQQPVPPQPVEYENVQYEPLVVELSQEALVKALRQLHPAGSW